MIKSTKIMKVQKKKKKNNKKKKIKKKHKIKITFLYK